MNSEAELAVIIELPRVKNRGVGGEIGETSVGDGS